MRKEQKTKHNSVSKKKEKSFPWFIARKPYDADMTKIPLHLRLYEHLGVLFLFRFPRLADSLSVLLFRFQRILFMPLLSENPTGLQNIWRGIRNKKNKRILLFIISDNHIRSNIISCKKKQFCNRNECSFFPEKYRKLLENKQCSLNGIGNKLRNIWASELLIFQRNTDSNTNRFASPVQLLDGDHVVVVIISISHGNWWWHLGKLSIMSWCTNLRILCTRIIRPDFGAS